MYIVTISGKDHEIEAKGMSVDQGTLIFFSNEEQTQSKLIVAAGKWEMLKVPEETNALQIQKKVQAQESEVKKEIVDAVGEIEIEKEEEKKGNGFEDHPCLQQKEDVTGLAVMD